MPPDWTNAPSAGKIDPSEPALSGAEEEADMAPKENKGGFLRWPWNAVVYVLLAVTLRLLAIPVILVLMGLQRKNNPHGRSEGFCLSRTRKRLTWLIWALLVLAAGGALLCMLSVGLRQDRTYWETGDYATLAFCGAGGPLLVAGGLYLAYAAIRDAFFPAKSALAKSIRSQLPYPEEAPPAAELFAMVDRDLVEALWFGPVGVGREWVLGDSVNRIDRIRGIFVVNEIHQHRTQTGVRTGRDMELVLVDDRWQRSVTSFNSLADLQAAAEYLRLQVPEAAWGSNGQNMDFWTMDESAREDFERDFRQRQALRASAAAQREVLSNGSQDMILRRRDGEVTSRVTAALVEDILKRCLDGQESGFELTPTRPLETQGRPLLSLDCLVQEDGKVLLLLELAPREEHLALARSMDRREALAVLAAWLRREAPDLADWDLRRLYQGSGGPTPQPRQSHARLSLVYASGAAENHTTFTEEDIQLAAEGIVDGTYQLVDLTHPEGFLWIRVTAGDRSDARCTVEAARPGGPELEFYITKMPPREAAAWLTGYPRGRYLPGGGDWKRVKKTK